MFFLKYKRYATSPLFIYWRGGMADTDADETLHFVNGKTDVDHCLQETKVKEKCWRISTPKKR